MMKYQKTKFVVLLFCIGLFVGLPISQMHAQNVSSQKHQITGVVKDVNGEAIIGVSVVEKGTTNGTMTDMRGNFTLSVRPGSQIVISSVGYRKEQFTTEGKSKFDVTLEEESKTLNEVVVVGFGTQKKINLTGAVSTVSSKDLASVPVSNATQALEGLVPGLQISQNMGGLASTASIDIRGVTTIGKGSSGSPLILIDGMEGDINTINPQDIENISVLKDAAASSIYGSRAPFGVILITTKSGGKGKVTINYNDSFRFNQPVLLPKEMDSYTFATYFNDANTNGNMGTYFDADRMARILAYQKGTLKSSIPANGQYWQDGYGYGNDNVDWYKVIYKNHSYSEEHNLSARGGNNINSYYFSLDYLDEDGLMKLSTECNERYGATAKINSQLMPWLKMQYTMRFIRDDYKRPQAMTSSLYSNLARQGWPTLPLKDPNGYYYDSPSPALELAQGGTYTTQNDNTYQQLSFVLEPIKNWITHAEFNYHIESNNCHWDRHVLYNHDVNGNPYVFDKNSYVHEDYYKENYYNINLYSEYSLKVAENNFKLMGGFQAEDLDQKGFGLQRNGIIVDQLPEVDLTSGVSYDGDAIVPSVNGSNASWSTAGFFGRLNYDYAGRYLAEVNMRYDGTSRFRKNNRWKMFPSVSLGWNIAREAFWGNLSDKIGTLKLRASYGELGNQNADNWYPTYRTISYTTNSGAWLQNDALTNVAYVPALVSSSLTWETSRTVNLGLDWGALNNRLTGSLDVYNRRTLNMIGPAPELPSVLGIAVPKTNNTNLKTYGWELSVGWNDHLNIGLNYGIHLTLSDSQTKITKYPNDTYALSDYYKGEKYGEIWGYQTIGIAKTDDEMTAHLATLKNGGQDALGSDWKAGDIMYKDINGDGEINNGAYTKSNHGDLKVIGNSTPRYLFGLDMNASYKGFDFRAFFQGVGKRDYFQGGQNYSGCYYFWGATNNIWFSCGLKQHADYFRAKASNNLPVNLNSYYPRPVFGTDKNEQYQTRYLLNAAYIRLKNIQLGFTIPQSITQKVSLTNVRVFVSAENVWTGTKMKKMFDPETIDGGSSGNGNAYPLMKTISFGLSVTL